jgi:hypothetical protein
MAPFFASIDGMDNKLMNAQAKKTPDVRGFFEDEAGYA